MQVTQLKNRQGGWPLNIIMTADKKPFYAGTYIPKHSRNGRLGLIELSQRIDQLWQEQRVKVEQSAESIRHALSKSSQDLKPDAETLDIDHAYQTAIATLKKRFDAGYGGFGDAPKFPSPHHLLLLLRHAHAQNDTESLHMVEQSLDAMRAGGLFDQIGFGFHRYSTDAQWLLPHFEKMLYDQAMLMMAYSEAYLITGHQRHASVVRELADYVLQTMRDPKGGFYSAEDADSDGLEGKFYMWHTSELEAILGKSDAAFAIKRFNCTPEGNVRDEATQQQTGANVLHLSQWREDSLSQEAETIRQTLLQARAQRTRPFLDDKILTDWNGLMIAALAKAGSALHEPQYIQAAQQAADFILRNMQTEEGRLLHRYRHGKAGITGKLDDYAYMLWGLIALYEADFDSNYLSHARSLASYMLQNFASPSGGLYSTSINDEALLIRPIEAWDGALPSGNSVAAHQLLRLHHLLADQDFADAAQGIISGFASLIKRSPSSFEHLLSAAKLSQTEAIELLIAGQQDSPEGQALIKALHSRFLPNSTLLWRDAGSIKLNPFIEQQSELHGQLTVYLCRQSQCQAPLHKLSDVLASLDHIQQAKD